MMPRSTIVLSSGIAQQNAQTVTETNVLREYAETKSVTVHSSNIPSKLKNILCANSVPKEISGSLKSTTRLAGQPKLSVPYTMPYRRSEKAVTASHSPIVRVNAAAILAHISLAGPSCVVNRSGLVLLCSSSANVVDTTQRMKMLTIIMPR